MSRIGPPPVDALPDITWARVERDLWAALDRTPVETRAATPIATRRSWARVTMAGALIAAAALVVFLVWPRGGAQHGDLPSRVATGPAPTTVSFGDAEITMAPQSTMVLAGTPARGVDIVLEAGSATFAVAPRHHRPPFVVHAGAVDVRVVGTRFTVTRSGDAARVEVADGAVEVVAHGHREHLLAGSSWDSSRGWEAAIRSSATITDPDDVAAARTLVDDRPVAAPPPVAARPPVAAPPPVTGPEPITAPDPRTAYEAAATLEPTDPTTALAAYRELARGRGPWAANALYAAARLADQEGDAALALTLARQYGERFAHGANAADAARLVTHLEGAADAQRP